MKFHARAFQMQQKFVEIILEKNEEFYDETPMRIVAFAEGITRALIEKEDAQLIETQKEVEAEQEVMRATCKHVYSFPSVSQDHAQTENSIDGRACAKGCGYTLHSADIPKPKKKHTHTLIGQDFVSDGKIGGTFTSFKCECGAEYPYPKKAEKKK